MAKRFCDVALPVPLRSTFTYAIPESVQLDDAQLIGRRVLVPFRNKPVAGVIVSVSETPPAVKRILEIAEVLDTMPALHTKLLELGRWVSRYYVAPVGESLRAMLPPDVGLRYVREYWITAEGRAYLADLAASEELTDVERDELAFLRRFENTSDGEEVITAAQVRRIAGGEAAAENHIRHGYLAARESAGKRKARTQKIVAWAGADDAAAASEAEARVREILTATRGPLPASKLLAEAKITPGALDKLGAAACAPGKSRSSPTKIPGIPTSLRPQINSMPNRAPHSKRSGAGSWLRNSKPRYSTE